MRQFAAIGLERDAMVADSSVRPTPSPRRTQDWGVLKNGVDDMAKQASTAWRHAVGWHALAR